MWAPAEEYERLPGTSFDVKEVTAGLGKTLSGMLLADYHLGVIRFPRLRFPRINPDAYQGGDYHTIAKKVADKKVRVWETRNDHGFVAFYQPESKKYHFVVTPKLAKCPTKHFGTVVHECTHAIQDMKGWRMSPSEMEVDAHFAQALYLIRAGREDETYSNSRLTRYVIAANAFNDDPRYLKSFDFARYREKMRIDVEQDYVRKIHALEPSRTPEEIREEFRKRTRLDGVPA